MDLMDVSLKLHEDNTIPTNLGEEQPQEASLGLPPYLAE